MKRWIAAAGILAVCVTVAAYGQAVAYDFEEDTVGAAPAGFSVTQTGGGTVTVEQDTDFGNFVRLSAPAGADTHINRSYSAEDGSVTIQCMLRAQDSRGNKKLLLRDSHAVFLELCYFRNGKFVCLNGAVEEEMQQGAVYALKFRLDLQNRSVEAWVNDVRVTGSLPNMERFDFSSFALRVQNQNASGLSVLDADNLSVAVLQPSQEGLEITPFRYENADGWEVETISPGDLQVCCTAANTGTEERELICIAAVQRDESLYAFSAQEAMIRPDEEQEIRVKIRIPQAYLNGGELCLFLWDSQTMEPVAKKTVSDRGKAYYAPSRMELLKDFAEHAQGEGRPWIITGRQQMERISQTADEDMSVWKEKLLASADTICTQEPAAYQLVDNRLLEVSRTVLDRVQRLSLAYIITADRKYKDRLYLELENAAQFPDWHPAHFLDTAEMTAAFAIGYDWLYNAWNADQRAVLRQAIVEKGLQPGLQCYKGELGSYGSWVNWDWNWNVVCNGGLALGALAVMDTDAELAAEILSRGLESYQAMVGEFAPDGAWKEGPVYWHYTIKYMVMYLSSMEQALGTDYGYGDAAGVPQTAYYLIYMTGVNNTFNLNDSGDAKVSSPELFWFAQRYGFEDVARYRLERIRSGYYNAAPMDLVWYIPPTDPDHFSMPLDRMFRGSEVATFRDSWDNTTLFAGLHGGQNNVPHGNLDAGTFVLDMLGERFACDLGGDSYELDGYFDSGGKRWNYYRTRAEGQNTILLDPGPGPDQTVDAFSAITAFQADAEQPYAIVDLTQALGSKAASAQRGMRLVNQRTGVILRDELVLNDSAETYWFMHTRAAIEQYSTDRRSVILEQNGKRIWVGILDGEGTFYDTAAVPLESSPQSAEQNQNRGIRKICIHRETISEWNLTVAFLPLQDGETVPQQIPAVSQLAEWQSE